MQSPLLPHDKLSFVDLSARAIQLWRLLLAGCLGLLLLGWFAWRNIPRREDPKVEVPTAIVTIVYPGASPEDVEAQVLEVVEEEMLGLDGIDKVDSLAMPNVAQFVMTFDDDVNMDVMIEKIRGKIQGRKKDMPDEVRDPDVVQVSTTRVPQMVIAVVGNRADDVLTEAAKRLKKQIRTLRGVAGVDLRGDQERTVRVQLDPTRLAQHGLSAEAVVKQLQLANVRIPAGEIKVGPLLALLKVHQEFGGAAAVMKVAVGASADGKGGTRVVSLGDVAEVKDGVVDPEERFMVDGLPAVALEVRFRADEDAIAVGEQVRQKLKAMESALPEGAFIHICHDQPKSVAQRISHFLESLFEGIILVMIVITFGMGWRAAVVVSFVLPLAVGGTTLGLYAFGMSLDQISIVGLIVALGLLVDDAVVVTESVQTMRDRGLSAVRAAVFGTARVFWANNGTTAVACASFVPIFFISGIIGRFAAPLPTAVILALVTSLVVAQLVTPWLSTLLLRAPAGTRPISDAEPFDRRQDTGGEHEEHNPVIRFLKRLYARCAPWIISNPMKVIGVATAMLVGAIALVPKVGIEFFPTVEKGMLFVSVELPRGSREELTAQKAIETAALIRAQPGVLATSAMIGSGYTSIDSVRETHGPGKDFADIMVQVKEGYRSADLASRLRKELTAIAGANVTVEEIHGGPFASHPIDIRITGDDYGKLQEHAHEITAKLREQKGTLNVRDTLSETVPIVRVELDADKARRVGITPAHVGGALRFLYGEDDVTEFRVGDDDVVVVIEPRPTPDSPLGSVEQTLIPNAVSGVVPLRQAGELTLERGFAEFARHNGRREVKVTADLEAGLLATDVIAELDPWLRARSWEPGYEYKFGGTAEDTKNSFSDLTEATLGSLLLISVLLMVIFNSFTFSVVVIAAVPYALIGAVCGLGLTGNHFGFMSFLGLIALIGVYVNHKIYFVDRLQELMRRGETLEAAIVQAGQDRLRPVVLTALTAILGLLPLTVGGGSLWSGFGWVNIFGLLTSIVLSLVVLPALIVVAVRLRTRLTMRSSKTVVTHGRPAPESSRVVHSNIVERAIL